jgi:UDP-N-acetylmuramoyl-L-alanyl-D-glutamate--2,6-diaminopimelate ligase
MKSSRHPPVTAYSASGLSRRLGDRQLFVLRAERATNGMCIAIDGSWGAVDINSPLIGAFNVENLLGVLGLLLGLGFSLADAATALEQCNAPPGRMEAIRVHDKPLVVVDYAHTPDALSKVLQTAREHTNGRLFCVFGCGGDRDAGKRPLMGEIAEQLADVVILTDDNPRTEDPDAIVADILQGFSDPHSALIERDRAKAIAAAIASAGPDDLVLIAGKGHENYQIIGRSVRDFSDRDVARKSLGLVP